MKPIRKRISRPYLLIIILIPILILLIFNVIVSFYTKSQAEKDLLNAVNNISIELSTQDNSNRVKPTPNSNNILSIINNQTYSNSAELIIFNANGELSKIFNQNSFVTDDLASLIYLESRSLSSNEIGTVKYQNENYYIVNVDYDGKILSDKMLYISKGLILNDFVNTINIVLLIVSILITTLALIISSKVTNAVAKPIEKLTSLVENMKSDELIIIDNDSDSLELKKLTSEINSLNRRIYNYDKSQKSFLHNASHEIRTPLMSIQGYADGIEMGVFEDYKGTAHLISEQSKKLTKLVDSLLKLARAENFSTAKKLEYINLSESLLSLINEYKGYALTQNIQLESNIEPDIFANSNLELLQGSVGNIISNAIRYAKNQVIISLYKNSDNIKINIRDDGNGIENMTNIFERFSKGSDGNFGLGLSIAKTSVQMMNGKIKAYNYNGAVFEITL